MASTKYTTFVTMDPFALQEDELDHELFVRDLNSLLVSSFVEKAQLLISNRSADAAQAQVGLLKPDEEYKILSVKIWEVLTIHKEIQRRNVEKSSRLSSLYCHCLFRLRRIWFRDPKLFEDFKRLARSLERMHPLLEKLYGYRFPCLAVPDDFEEKNKSREMSDDQEEKKKSGETSDDSLSGRFKGMKIPKKKSKAKKKKEKKTSKKKKRKKKISSSSSEGSEESESTSTSDSTSDSDESTRGSKTGQRSRRVNPVSKWNYRFEKNEDLSSFLADVEDARLTHDVTEEELLKGFGLLLGGNALKWYRSARKDIHSWRQLKREIKEAFSPAEDDDDILDKVRKLKQAPDETYVVFEARMKELFARVSRSLDESEKVKKLLNGLNIYYRSRIQSREVRSLKALRSICTGLEADKAHIIQLQKEEQRKEEKARDEKRFDRKPEKRVHVAAATEGSEPEEGAAAALCTSVDVSAIATRPVPMIIQCWKCGKHGHYAHVCPEKISCIVCGQADTVVERCSRCSGYRAQMLWGAAMPENQRWSWQGGNPGPMDSNLPPRYLQQPVQPQRMTTPTPSQTTGQPQATFSNRSQPARSFPQPPATSGRPPLRK